MGSNLTKILIVPDTHVPYHDKNAWNLCLKAAKAWKPDKLVIIGDFADCYSISDHRKDPSRLANLASEIVAVNVELDRVQALKVPNVVYVCGNHEQRFERYLADRAPELFGTSDMQTLLRISERGWKWVPYQKWFRYGKLAFTHDLGHAGKNCARDSLNSFGGNIVIGHSHGASVVYSGTVEGERHVAMNVGWLGRADEATYLHSAKQREWQHGFGIAHMDKKTGHVWCSFVPIIGKTCVVDGKKIVL